MHACRSTLEDPTGAEYWSAISGGWARWEPIVQHAMAPVNPILIRAARLSPGQRVLDLACGSGDPAFEIARVVAPRGRVLGVDVAPDMLALARRRARVLGIRNVRFMKGNLSKLRLGSRRFDRVLSRFGLMFPRDVAESLASIRRYLAPRGRIAVAVWTGASRNPSHAARLAASKPFLREPEPDPESGPHPLRLGRPGLLPRLMRQAGFRDVRAEEVRMSWVYPTPADYARMQTETSLAELYLSLPTRDQKQLRARLERVVKPFVSDHAVRIPGSVWVVSARR